MHHCLTFDLQYYCCMYSQPMSHCPMSQIPHVHDLATECGQSPGMPTQWAPQTRAEQVLDALRTRHAAPSSTASRRRLETQHREESDAHQLSRGRFDNTLINKHSDLPVRQTPSSYLFNRFFYRIGIGHIATSPMSSSQKARSLSRYPDEIHYAFDCALVSILLKPFHYYHLVDLQHAAAGPGSEPEWLP